jgi:hypothetical protein
MRNPWSDNPGERTMREIMGALWEASDDDDPRRQWEQQYEQQWQQQEQQQEQQQDD